MTEKEMYQKVYGCWLGKNIGGTLGGPVEGNMSLMNHTFYTQRFDGKPMENDDLDLQLLNLHAVEQYGINITSRHLSAEWKSHVFFCMDEYALFLSNARRGVQTPLSGHFNNEFTHCMGSPIRSEIWAVMAPSNPELAAYFAYQDAAVDHAGGEGVYGEVFFAALESMAFDSTELEALTEKALTFIPDDCETAKAINDLLKYYHEGVDWLTARQRLIDDYGTDNFCYAPLNIAFTMLGLFYGEDFSDKLLKCLNCGYDTDCTAATAGSILGIMYGAENIPQKWIEPIGTSIVSCPQVNGFKIPKDIAELTERSIKAQKMLAAAYDSAIDKSVFTIDYDTTTTKFGLPLDCICEQDLLVSLNYKDDNPSIGRNEVKTLVITLKNKMYADYSGSVGLISLDGLEVGEPKSFSIAPGESFVYETYVKGDGEYRYSYPLDICVKRFVSDMLWSEERLSFALCPTFNWTVRKNDGDEKRIASPTHRIAFEKVYDLAVGDRLTAETVLTTVSERALRFMLHTAHSDIKLYLDGELIIDRKTGDPYLPAYHRVAPDAKPLVTAGVHTLRAEVTVADIKDPFDVAVQVVDLSTPFAPNRGFLQEELLTSFDFK